MPRYRYKATTQAGQLLEGELEAGSADGVLQRLHAEGHIPIRADELRTGTRVAWLQPVRLRARRVSARDVEGLTHGLAALLDAGFPLERALRIQCEASAAEPVRRIMEEMQTSVRSGISLSAAIEACNGLFGPLYVNMVRAGEIAGNPAAALRRLGEHLERARELRESVSAALIYPVILAGAGVASLLLVLGVVVPRFAEMFAEAGQSLPFSTRVVVNVGQFLQRYWWLIGGALATGYWLLQIRLRDAQARHRWHGRLLRLPVAGEIITALETSRFTRTLAALLNSGVTLQRAVEIASEVVGNRAIAGAVRRVAERIRQGQGLSRPLLEERVFPDRATYMLRVGEESGRLEEMLLRTAELYEREVQRSTRRLVALIEPALILVMGLAIGAIVMSIVAAVLALNRLGAM